MQVYFGSVPRWFSGLNHFAFRLFSVRFFRLYLMVFESCEVRLLLRRLYLADSFVFFGYGAWLRAAVGGDSILKMGRYFNR